MAALAYLAPDFIREGRLCWFRSPLYIVNNKGKETYYFTDEEFNKNRSKIKGEVTRAKGLGELPAETARESMFNEQNQRLDVMEWNESAIDLLYNSPCIILWTIFNEAWGQFDAKEIYESLKKIDNTRLYDHASGWHDQESGDFKSMHIYKWKVKVPKKRKLKNRAFICSECGAYILDKRLKEAKKKEGFIYLLFNNKEDFQKEYERFIKNEILPAKENGMAGFIYTQIRDVEEEMNGFVSYDRKEIKVDVNKIKELNDLI